MPFSADVAEAASDLLASFVVEALAGAILPPSFMPPFDMVSVPCLCPDRRLSCLSKRAGGRKNEQCCNGSERDDLFHF